MKWLSKSAVAICILLGATVALAAEADANLDRAATRQPGTLRIATFNVSLAGQKPAEMLARLQAGDDPQARAVAEIIQRVQPDVLFLNELDFDERGAILTAFADNYLAKDQGISTTEKDGDKSAAIKYAHRYLAPVNTGIATAFDLDRDGVRGAEVGTNAYARDAMGYGQYPGQYGMAILSRLPIDESQIRTFQKLRWRDMPNAKLPTQKDDSPWYEAAALEELPLSSKSHWDVPIRVGSRTIHLLASHPTPPVFDGPEDRNGRRNHDEIRLWADYLTPGAAKYIVDDRGQRGGLGESESFVIVGDLNSDPEDGNGQLRPIRLLLEHARVNSTMVPRSAGASAAAKRQGGANEEQRGKTEADTGDFPDEKGPGNLRLDYVLPSRDLAVSSAGVYWPGMEDSRYALVGAGHPVVSSDHRLVWLDIAVPTIDKASP